MGTNVKKNITGVFIFCFLSGFILLAGNGSIQKTGIPGDLPKAEFEVTTHDFGIIKSGDKAVVDFVFVNSGKTPLILSNVKSSCGCTVPQWTKTPIHGGKKDSIRVEYNTKIKGAFSKTITVHTNASNPVVELVIKGNVVRK